MSVLHCSICGQIIPPPETDADSEPARHSTVCNICSSKLDSAESTNRTTIMRPVASANFAGKAILASPSESSEKTAPLVINPPAPEANAAAAKGSSRGSTPEQEIDVTVTQDLPARRKFGNYEILNEISRGSFGVVYKAKQRGLDRVVALKVLLAGVHASAEAVARFQREAKSVARLKHPNIVPIYDIGMHDGHHYFAMEFVEGAALSTLISNKTATTSQSLDVVTTSQALEIAEGLADALESAHHAGIIHRDIKPSNILIDPHGSPHITDFGLAKQVDLDTKYTMSGTTLGTPAYMPPEQARGEIEKIDARSDVYAIGAVLYEMLTGQTPFAGRSLLEVVVAVINEPVKPPRLINPRIHRDVQTIVMKCLEKDPRQRYASAAELRDDLRRFRSGENIKARPAGPLRLTGRFLRRNGMLILGGSAAVVTLATLFYQVETTKQEKQEAEADREKLLREKRDEMRKKEPTWRPVWWFPPKNGSEFANDEERKLFEIPEGKGASFKSMVKGRDVPDHILKRVKAPDGTHVVVDDTIHVKGAETLVSPEDTRFSLDVDARLVVNWPDPTRKLRVGLQGIAERTDGIPLIAEFVSGSVRLIGPAEIYSHAAHSQPGKAPPLKLEIKAEKDAPAFPPGQYKIVIHREGTLLSAKLTGPDNVTCSIQIKDANLTSWVFKNMQLVVRHPPPGLLIISGEVQQKFGGDEDPAFRHFREGEYSVAETELKFIATNPDETAYKRARALFQLGLIQEICQPQSARDQGYYTDALSELAKVPKDDPLIRDTVQLKRELRLRRVVAFAKNRQWMPAIVDELNEAWSDTKIGEPLAWELASVLQMAAREPEKLDPAARDADKQARLQASLAIFQYLGLEPGSARFGRLASALAAPLRTTGRYEDLIALHQAYPADLLRESLLLAARDALKDEQLDSVRRLDTAMLLHSSVAKYCREDNETKLLTDVACDLVSAAMKNKRYSEAAKLYSDMATLPLLKTLCAEIELQAKDLADNEFQSFITKLFPAMVAGVPDDKQTSDRFNAAIDKLAIEIINTGRVTKLIRLHDALRGNRLRTDPRMAGAFAAAIQRLAQVGDAGSEELTITLLNHCASYVGIGHPEIQKAVCAFAATRTAVDDNPGYSFIMALQRAYPTPELYKPVEKVLRDMVTKTPKRYSEAIFFFSQARVELGRDTLALTPLAVGALENIRSSEQRMQLLSSIWDTVHSELVRRQRFNDDRQWHLEYGDIQLALNQWEGARDKYQELFNLPDVDPDLLGKAGLRLLVMNYARPGIANPVEILPLLLTADQVSEEYKLALRMIAQPDQVRPAELKDQLAALPGTRLLREWEWQLVRGIRERMDGNAAAATTIEGATRTASSCSWVCTVGSFLVRGVTRSPEDDVKIEVPKPKSDATAPMPLAPAGNN